MVITHAPLTPAMIDLILAMQAGVKVVHLGGIRPHYYRKDTNKNCTRQVFGLSDRGLAVYYDEGRVLAGMKLTTAGKAWKPSTERGKEPRKTKGRHVDAGQGANVAVMPLWVKVNEGGSK